MKYRALFTLAALLILAHSIAAHENIAETIIHISEEGFVPRTLDISAGTTVIFENVGTKPHWPASNIHPTHEIYPEFDPKLPLEPGESWSFTFTKPGTWTFHDHAYPSFTGSIQVNDTVPKGVLASMRAWFYSVIQTLPFPAPLITALFVWQPTESEQLPEFVFDASISENNEDLFKNETALYSYVKRFGPTRTIAQLHEMKSRLPGDCHQTAHRAGRFSYELFGEAAFQNCTSECHAGCYHGAIEAYFKGHGTTNIPAAMDAICGEEDNKFFAHQCFHGIGHGLMAWSGYELLQSLETCKQLQQGKESCYSGVFMENIVGGLAEEHNSSYLNDDPHYPCTIVDEQYKKECYFFQTARMYDIYKGDFAKITAGCLEAPENHQYICFESLGRDISGHNKQDPDVSLRLCMLSPKGILRTGCFKGAAQDMFWDPSGQDRALRFCTLLETADEQSACYYTVFSRARDVLPSAESARIFCDKAATVVQDACKHIVIALKNSSNDYFAKQVLNCIDTPEHYKTQCFAEIGWSAGILPKSQPDIMLRACEFAPPGMPRVVCVTNATLTFFQRDDRQDTAVRFCTLINNTTEKTACYRAVVKRAKELNIKDAVCEKIEKEHRELCT